jgi:hypothetical protein
MPMACSADTKPFHVPTNQWGMAIWNEPDAWAGCAMVGRGQIPDKGWCVAWKTV